MQVGDRVHVRPKEALAPYKGNVAHVDGETVAVSCDDGTVRSHPLAHVDVVLGACNGFGEDVHVSQIEPIATAVNVKAKRPRAPRKPKAKK